jgi:hypothetical protein
MDCDFGKASNIHLPVGRVYASGSQGTF